MFSWLPKLRSSTVNYTRPYSNDCGFSMRPLTNNAPTLLPTCALVFAVVSTPSISYPYMIQYFILLMTPSRIFVSSLILRSSTDLNQEAMSKMVSASIVLDAPAFTTRNRSIRARSRARSPEDFPCGIVADCCGCCYGRFHTLVYKMLFQTIILGIHVTSRDCIFYDSLRKRNMMGIYWDDVYEPWKSEGNI